jgi:hypothetical protein
MSNITNISEWKKKSSLLQMRTKLETGFGKLIDGEVESIAFFYIVEPLNRGLVASFIIDQNIIAKVAESEEGVYGDRESIYKITCEATAEYLLSVESGNCDDEVSKFAVYTNLVNLASSESTINTLKRYPKCRHFGVMIYENIFNEQRDGISISPIAMLSDKLMISEFELWMSVCERLMEEQKSKPQYFNGVNLRLLIQKILSRFPEELEQLKNLSR